MFIDLDYEDMKSYVDDKLHVLESMKYKNVHNINESDIKDVINNTLSLLENDGLQYAYLFLGGAIWYLNF